MKLMNLNQNLINVQKNPMLHTLLLNKICSALS